MTRINLVHPSKLADQHLLAEHRELTRIPNAVLKRNTNFMLDLPTTYRMGPGHVRFFYNKLGFLYSRYLDVGAECICRRFNIVPIFPYKEDFYHAAQERLWNDWKPSQGDIRVSQNRLLERWKPSFRYYSKPLSYEAYAIQLFS